MSICTQYGISDCSCFFLPVAKYLECRPCNSMLIAWDEWYAKTGTSLNLLYTVLLYGILSYKRVVVGELSISITADLNNVYLDNTQTPGHTVYIVSDKMSQRFHPGHSKSSEVLAIMIVRLAFSVVLVSSIIWPSLGSSQKAREASDKSISIQSWQPPRQVKWFCFTNSTNNTIDCCQFYVIKCLENGPALPQGYCATYSEDNYTQSLTIVKCFYFQSTIVHYNITTYQKDTFILLPVSVSELNEYMCSPLYRKGTACSQCATGYGPSVISDRYECAKCTHLWYGVFVYIMVEFAPITVSISLLWSFVLV